MKIMIMLKPDELDALVRTLEFALFSGDCETREDAVIRVVLLRFYKKMKQKSILLDRKLRTEISVETALAFISYFENIQINPTSFEGNIIRKLLCQFDSKTSSMHHQ